MSVNVIEQCVITVTKPDGSAYNLIVFSIILEKLLLQLKILSTFLKNVIKYSCR